MKALLKTANLEWLSSLCSFKSLFDVGADNEEDTAGDVTWAAFSGWIDSLAAKRRDRDAFAKQNSDAINKIVDGRIEAYDKCTKSREEVLQRLFVAGSSKLRFVRGCHPARCF